MKFNQILTIHILYKYKTILIIDKINLLVNDLIIP